MPFRILLILIVLFNLSSCAAYEAYLEEIRAHDAPIQAVRPGMTRNQVYRDLGIPDYRNGFGDIEILAYCDFRTENYYRFFMDKNVVRDITKLFVAHLGSGRSRVEECKNWIDLSHSRVDWAKTNATKTLSRMPPRPRTAAEQALLGALIQDAMSSNNSTVQNIPLIPEDTFSGVGQVEAVPLIEDTCVVDRFGTGYRGTCPAGYRRVDGFQGDSVRQTIGNKVCEKTGVAPDVVVGSTQPCPSGYREKMLPLAP